MPPVAGDDLVFPDGADSFATTNDFPAGATFGAIAVSGSGYTLVGNLIGG